jgi:hypothetical protein
VAINERARLELYAALEEIMGTERADTLMGLLPPVGWADVATKHDLASVEERIYLRFDKFEAHTEAKLERELRTQTRNLLFGLLTALLTMASICIAAIALAR